ncbi:MAG: [FeFe] hydrogenase H-cluster maturation GTPase HydF [Thermoanaerobaculia bacterium]
MSSAPRGLRTHIGLFGRRNVGKSSVLNALTRQEVAIVSATPGTTTDPVEKPMELLPLGPVVFIDTAGIDDEGILGEQRVAKTKKALERTDLALLVAEASSWGPFEEELLAEIRARSIPVVVVLNKADAGPAPAGLAERLATAGVPAVETSIPSGAGIDELRQALLAAAPADAVEGRRIVGDLVSPGDVVVLVTPIDAEAPKGRLILPQVQTLRDLLDTGAISVVVREHELRGALAALAAPPRLVVTDSQAFRQVALEIPPGVPLTSFSILFARFQGDLAEMARGVRGVERLKAGDRVLVAEACTHHPVGEDIGRVKIPAWLRARTGVPLEFETVQGRDFPDDLSRYALVVHCGSCMGNRRQMLSRLLRGRQEGVPVTNYGLTIAYSLGILERALEPFPAALEAYRLAAPPPSSPEVTT